MKVKARDFDKKFDKGADISKHLDVTKAKEDPSRSRKKSKRRLPRVDETLIG